jgi:hypothetical protein
MGEGATTASAVVSHGDLSWIVWVDSTPDASQGSPVLQVDKYLDSLLHHG